MKVTSNSELRWLRLSRWDSVADNGPASKQNWIGFPCLLGYPPPQYEAIH